jgi:hypothetical protein
MEGPGGGTHRAMLLSRLLWNLEHQISRTIEACHGSIGYVTIASAGVEQ